MTGNLAGVLVISIVEIINVVTNLVAIYIMITDWRAFADSPTSVALVICYLVVGLILFYVMKYFRKSQGVRVYLTFREIPVE